MSSDNDKKSQKPIKLPSGLTPGNVPPSVWNAPRGDGDRNDDPSRLLAGIGKLNAAFDDFKGRQEKRLEDISGQIDDHSETLKDLHSKLTMLDLLGFPDDPRGKPTTKDMKALTDYVRFGIKAALHTESGPDGGFLVPDTLGNAIAELSRNYSPMRQLADVALTSGNFSKIVSTSGSTADWVSESQARPATANGAFAKITPPMGEIYASPKATQTALEDSAYDLGTFLEDDIAKSFAVKEGAAFVSGDGINKPFGFLSATKIADASWAWGKLGFHVTGHASSFVAASSTASPADCLIELQYKLKAVYRSNASWIMNSTTAGVVRKFKDAEGRFIWSDSLQADQPPLLLGRPVYLDENMPDIGANAFPIAYGDFKSGYLICDRVGVTITRDPYTDKPNVLFYTRKRVCLLYTSPSPRDGLLSRMPSSA